MAALILFLTLASGAALAQSEADYSTIVDIPAPEEIVLEVGGLAWFDDERLLASTRRGDIWLIEDALSPTPTFRLWADGLQEPLGLLIRREGNIHGLAGIPDVLVAQRGELCALADTDGDGRADIFHTICDAWTISGNYHEYAFGPRADRAGNLWITLNKPFGGEPFGRAPWRGWAARITPEGRMEPVTAGLRSPAGLECSPWGAMFYTDNQGEWCGASKLAHLEVGEFHGHPHGIDSCHLPQSLVEHPGAIPDGVLMPEVARQIPSFKLPAVWFPYDKMGKSPAGFVWDTEGNFPPFQGQLFVGDQTHASVMRVDLEQVRGHWQGACFPFREGFGCGIIRVSWAPDGSLVVGMTNRGWASKGDRPYGLQRLVWKGETPFEILRMRAAPYGFVLELTEPVDAASVTAQSFSMISYTYLLHSRYGSPEVDKDECAIAGAAVTDNGMRVHLFVEGLRAGYVHELHADGLRSTGGAPLLHPDAYYTLIQLAEEL